jgi:hypothetical protein
VVADHPRYSGRAAFALATAVAVTGLAGYLISRPSGPLRSAPPVSTTPPQQHDPAPIAPQSAGGFSVADDPAVDQVVMFGGLQDDEATWVYDGTRWALEEPKVSPPGRIDAAIAYDPLLHLVVLFGGHGAPGTDLHDTWAWAGATWHELDKGSDGVPPADADMAWDPGLDQLVLIAAGSADTMSSTWVWSGAHWTRRSTGPPATPAAVALGFDPSSHRLLAVGLVQPFSPTLAEPTQTWTWNGSGWRQLPLRADPLAVEVRAVALDPASGQLLLFTDQPSRSEASAVWSWNGSEWMESTTPAQAILDGATVTTNTSLLLVGALDSTARGAATPVQVYVWTANRWQGT